MPITVRRVNVRDRALVSIIQTGDGDRWNHDTAKQIERRARILAPARTRRLSGSHVTLPTRGTNPYVKKYRVTAQAPYAAFVALGTGIHGPLRRRITSSRGMGPLPGAGTGPGRFGRGRPKYIWVSDGQRPNRWLERAAMSVAAGTLF